jgi:carboxyl-terminal processing protease
MTQPVGSLFVRRLLLAASAALFVLGCSLLTIGGGAPGARAENKYRLTAVGLAADSATGLPAVRSCDYVPGRSTSAVMPPEVLNPPPPPTATLPALPTPASVPSATRDRQLGLFSALWNAVNDNYVDPQFNGQDWKGIGDRYRAVINQGLTDTGFSSAMKRMVAELKDDHSQYQDPAEVAAQRAEIAAGVNFVGIGAQIVPIPETVFGSITLVFPGSPAAAAGLKPHDAILAVDGLPVRDDTGKSRTLGAAGTKLMLTYQRPGEAARTIEMTRRAVTGFIPIDYCIVPATRIGYVFLPTFLDETIDDQVREALQKMTRDGPLQGLILDNRMNGGGSSLVAEPMLGFFTGGVQGAMVSRASRREYRVQAEDVGGSQAVPLVVLVDTGTVSYAEVFSGVLQHAHRATIVGGLTNGNVEILGGYSFNDDSRAWIATFTFEPVGLRAGIWEDTGIVPDVGAPTRWDLFTEATDPALAKAVEVLLRK